MLNFNSNETIAIFKNTASMGATMSLSGKTLKLGVVVVVIIVCFSGALFLSAYFANFTPSVQNFDVTLDPLEEANTEFSLSIDSFYGTLPQPGENANAPYYIGPSPVCNSYDGDFNCIDQEPNLCPYISLEPQDGEATESGFSKNPNGFLARGLLNRPDDEADVWTLSVQSPCFEGECPANYYENINGTPLPQADKGKTFKCNLFVESDEIPEIVRYFAPEKALADDTQNSIEISAVFTGGTDTCTTDCFSNVLFLPGIKGSVLKKSADTLWPPTVFSFNDIEQLALTDEGESEYNIYTDGILNKFITTPIYEPFSDFMDGLILQELINEWLPLAYDWRFSPKKILQDGIKTQSEVLNVIDEIETLAINSKTGKVIIVAHSMGGFFGKAIIKELENRGESGLIDSFVMVGVPQLGTPQATAAMLHGDDEGIVAGLVVNASEMRAIAQNMPSAYNLLPSPQYFDQVSDPVIKFDPTKPFTEAWRTLGGKTINIYNIFPQRFSPCFCEWFS